LRRMSARSKDLWAATLGGLIVGGILSAVLSIPDLQYSTLIGAAAGGIVAGYVLYGKTGQAAAVGALAGILGTPFFLGVSQIFLIFELIPIPNTPTPPLSQLQEAVAFILLTNLAAGAFGGAIGGSIHHRTPEMPTPQPAAQAGTVAPQVRYCVQCGAQLHGGEVICPHCSARQPQQ
jgi:putative hemolysin